MWKSAVSAILSTLARNNLSTPPDGLKNLKQEGPQQKPRKTYQENQNKKRKNMELKVKTRTILGKKTKNIRKEGLIPAELFGHDFKNRHLAVPAKDFAKVYREAGKSTIINLDIEGKEKVPVLIYDLQINPITQKPLAIDFYRVRANEVIEMKVPLRFTGAAPAEKAGFLIVKVLDEIEIKALPHNIPHFIEVDLSTLQDKEDKITVADLKPPADVKILTSPETVITIVSEKEEKEIEEAPSVEEIEAKIGEEEPKEEKAEAEQ